MVQAGTGTGKSLAYLVPAFLRSGGGTGRSWSRQRPSRCRRSWSDAISRSWSTRCGSGSAVDRTYAILKGRHNYACLHRVRDGVPDEQGTLVDVVPTGPLGRQVQALRTWAEQEAERDVGRRWDGAGRWERAARRTATGTRRRPTRTGRGRRSRCPSRECLGAQRCPYGEECFAERARERALAADVIVTNHALLAIDALENVPVLPDYDVVVVDEAHELAARVTSTASAELAPGMVAAGGPPGPRRSATAVKPIRSRTPATRCARARRLHRSAGWRHWVPSSGLRSPSSVTPPARAWSAFPSEKKEGRCREGVGSPAGAGVRRTGPRRRRPDRGDVAARRRLGGRTRPWRAGAVGWHRCRWRGLVREQLLAERTCVLTSATMKLGGDFDASARSVGLRPVDRLPDPPAWTRTRAAGRQPRTTAADGGPASEDRLVSRSDQAARAHGRR